MRWPTPEIYDQEVQLAKKELEKLVLGERKNQAINLASYWPYPIVFLSEFETDHGTFILEAKVIPKT